MPDSHPLVCRFGALGNMIRITPLLKLLYRRSELRCDIVAFGAWNRQLFVPMPHVCKLYSIDSLSTRYWFNRSQRELISQLKQRRHRFVWICGTSKKSYRLLAPADIAPANSTNPSDLEPVRNQHYPDK